MKISEFITVTAIKTMFGKRTGAIKAEIAGTGLSANAETASEAIANLHKMLSDYDRHGSSREYWQTNCGKTLCLYYTPQGWCYDIFTPGTPMPSTCLMPCQDREHSRKAVQTHLKQYNEQ